MKKKNLMKKVGAAALCLTLAASVTGCNGAEAEKTESETKAEEGIYQPTEENGNLELVMNDQPESSYWFPEQLLEWNAEEDPDLAFNVSTVPLAKRVDADKLTPVNKTQNTDTKVMAISIMNSSTSGNAPHGLNKADANTFTYWQYVDKLVYWGGSSGEGIIVPPSPDVTDMGHKNGVPVLGTVFFPQTAHGGKLEWLNTALKEENGVFPFADKLIEVAKTYGFDGWFINQESEGTEEDPLTKEHADAMQKFIKYFKAQAPELTAVYYDSMTKDGEMDWQNALTDKNEMFMVDEEGNAVADDMFLNFWWSEDELADQKLIEASAAKAGEIGVDPYALYAGIDVQANGYNTPARWDLFAGEDGKAHTSLGLYCPSWAYFSSVGVAEFQDKETTLWVNNKMDPRAEISYSNNTLWRGVSTYVTEKSAITELPFTTNFSLGNGYGFYKNGELISNLDWNNRSISGIQPTYRWILDQEDGNSLKAMHDVGNGYYGGNALRFLGNMAKDKVSTIKLFSADLPLEKDVIFTTAAKAKAETQLSAVLTFDDGSEEVLKGDKKVGTDWTTVTYDVSKFEGKNIRAISYQASVAEDAKGYDLNLGNIAIYRESDVTNAEVKSVSVDGSEFDEDAMYAGVRLSWEAEGEAPYYEVYRVNQDKTLSLLGVSNTTSFYINTLPRTDDTNKSTFKVVPVSMTYEDGKAAETTMDWPDNSIPKARFIASQTLVGPGTTVTFTSTCSENTKDVEWTLPGASEETATGESVKVTYDAEGVYDVKVTAKNDSGENEFEVKGCIVVTADLAADQELDLLSQGQPTEATTFVNDNEAPQFAVDGDVTKKWCATGTPAHELTIDLGEEKTVSQVGISHAEAGGEGADMNTKAYKILVSTDGAEFTEVCSITRNSAGSTLDTFAPVSARYVKLSVIKPTQGSDTAARIYEVEVFGK